MMFRSQASLRVAASLAALLIVSACSDGQQAQLSAVETIEVPTATPGQQANQNISDPTLEIPVTYPVADGDELTLVWSEEFDGPDIDPERWFFATGDGTEKGLPGGWGNNELQYYLPDNAMIVNGALEITARRETVGDLDYTSARINTEDRFAFKYGRIEASIKLPAGQGLWPAFWMLSQDSDYLCGGVPCVWAAIGEIDIVEAVNLDGTGGNEIFATLHYGGEFPNNTSSGDTFTPAVDVTDDFHTYAIEWDEDEIRWYFDNQIYLTQNSWFSTADNQPYPAPFNQNFHILLNLAVGGDFPGAPNGTTPFPATMAVDWVRVYSGEPPPAESGAAPDDGVFSTDPNAPAPLAPPGGLDNFGSGATFNSFFAGDADFKPTLQVTSGNAYLDDEGAPADVGFVAFVGYEAGFAVDYETFSFKVKGLPSDELEVKFFGSPDISLIINLSTYAGATDLGNGWYQVTIPMSEFAANINAFKGFLIGPPGDQGAPFSFLLTDIGFSGTIVTSPADPGTTPDVSLYALTGLPDLVFGEDYQEITTFGSGALLIGDNMSDVDFSPVTSVTTGFGYNKWNAQLAYTGFAAGFASAYETLDFKVKGMSGDVIRVKLLNDPNPAYVDIDLTSSGYATALGNGWYQVAVPIADFPGDVATASGLLFETIEPAPETSFTFLLTDIGFSGTPEPGDGELLTNGDFEAGQDPWINQGTVIDDGGNNVLQAVVTNPDPGQPFLVNASQIIPITPGETYTLTFRARATVARNIIAGI
ncbi:MAG: family 16 glycosylhydrolase, partial [Woeseia sp.]|nr:family 16 glycosylhydrolase [Woeseia sp.]